MSARYPVYDTTKPEWDALCARLRELPVRCSEEAQKASDAIMSGRVQSFWSWWVHDPDATNSMIALAAKLDMKASGLHSDVELFISRGGRPFEQLEPDRHFDLESLQVRAQLYVDEAVYLQDEAVALTFAGFVREWIRDTAALAARIVVEAATAVAEVVGAAVAGAAEGLWAQLRRSPVVVLLLVLLLLWRFASALRRREA